MVSKEELHAERDRLVADRKKNSSLGWYQRLGGYLRELIAKTDYGDRKEYVKELAKEWRLATSELYRAMRLAELYPGRKIDELRGLTFTAVRPLLRKKHQSDDARQKLLEQAVSGDWKGPRLRRAVDQRCGTCPPRGGGRRKRKRTGNRTDLAELARLSRCWRHFVLDVWSADRLSKVSPDGDELAKRVQLADQALSAVIGAIESCL
jgi:hypothetical protein